MPPHICDAEPFCHRLGRPSSLIAIAARYVAKTGIAASPVPGFGVAHLVCAYDEAPSFAVKDIVDSIESAVHRYLSQTVIEITDIGPKK